MAVIDIFDEKRKSCNHRCPDSVYFHTLLLIMYLSAIERLICRLEMSLRGSTSFNACFSKYRIELIVALSSTNATIKNQSTQSPDMQICEIVISYY